MIVFHGSHLMGLKKLTYSEENSRFGGDQRLLHGAAIYLTISDIEAQAYATGGSYYKVQVKGEIFDSTDKSVLNSFVGQFEKKHCIQGVLLNSELIQRLIEDTSSGKSSAVIFAQNLDKIIMNDSELYTSVISDVFNDDLDLCLKSLDELFYYKLIKIKTNDDSIWVLCLDHSGDCLEILAEIVVE